MAFFGLVRNLRRERAGFALYATAVGAARNPYFYTVLGVPDTLDGRFDLVGIHAFLLIRRLQTGDGAARAVAQSVFDAMFSDMDVTLREIGVGDMSIGKRVRAMWEAFHGRATAYAGALDDADPAVLVGALARNVWRSAGHEHANRLAAVMRGQDADLAAQPAGVLTAGIARFADPVLIGAPLRP